jgi:hypothetical protein
MTLGGLICADFLDLRRVVQGAGRAVFATAEASGPKRLRLATDHLISKLKI